MLCVLIRIISSSNSNEHTQYTIFKIIKKIGDFFLGLRNKFQTAVVNEPSVFEPLKFYCNSFQEKFTFNAFLFKGRICFPDDPHFRRASLLEKLRNINLRYIHVQLLFLSPY